MNFGHEYILNIGPHHPSTHGVLRLVLKLEGEIIQNCNAEIGYLHRGVEKLVEKQKWIQIIPFLDRLDYLAVSNTEHVYALALEKLCNIEPTKRSMFIRVIFDELTRIASHLMAIACQTHELGMLSVFLYSIEEREKIMKIFEIVTGARMHLTYCVVGGVFNDISGQAISLICQFLEQLDEYMQIVKKMALNNRIFQQRTVGVGVINKIDIENYCLTGPIARASGIQSDMRLNMYSVYNELDFDVVTEQNGDCYARFLVRFNEIKQSSTIILQCIEKMPNGQYNSLPEITALSQKNNLNNEVKEAIYSYFWVRGVQAKVMETSYADVEGPRGALGIFLKTEADQSTPYRLHLRSPSFAHIQYLQKLLVGCNIQDAIAISGSFDISISDCDR